MSLFAKKPTAFEQGYRTLVVMESGLPFFVKEKFHDVRWMVEAGRVIDHATKWSDGKPLKSSRDYSLNTRNIAYFYALKA